MGNSNSDESHFDYILDQWEPYHFEQEVEIMRNMTDGRLAERKDIFLDAQNTYQNDVDIYRLRKQNKFNLVQVCAVQKKVNRDNRHLSSRMCQNKCSQIESYQILTQYMVKRLNDIYLYSMSQFFYALHCCLIGYRKINTIFGKVKITPKMIGVNYKGQLKVWVNQNFADNMPECQIPDQQKGDEQIMIQDILKMILSRCKQNFQQISKFIYEFQPFSKLFRTAIKFVETYIQQKRLYIGFLPAQSDMKEQGRMLSDKNLLIKQQTYQNTNELTSSNKSFGLNYDWYSPNYNLVHNKNSYVGNEQVNNYNRSEKRSPYMKLNLMQSKAKTQPKFNSQAQFDTNQNDRLFYNYNNSNHYKIANSSNPTAFQNPEIFQNPVYRFQARRNQNFQSFGHIPQPVVVGSQPVVVGTQQHNFPIYKRLSEAEQYHNFQF